MDNIDNNIKEISEQIRSLTEKKKQLQRKKEMSEWADAHRDEAMNEIREIVYGKVKCKDYIEDDLRMLSNEIYDYFYKSDGCGYKKEMFDEGNVVSDTIEYMNESIINETLFIEALKEIQKKYLNSEKEE